MIAPTLMRAWTTGCSSRTRGGPGSRSSMICYMRFAHERGSGPDVNVPPPLSAAFSRRTRASLPTQPPEDRYRLGREVRRDHGTVFPAHAGVVPTTRTTWTQRTCLPPRTHAGWSQHVVDAGTGVHRLPCARGVPDRTRSPPCRRCLPPALHAGVVPCLPEPTQTRTHLSRARGGCPSTVSDDPTTATFSPRACGGGPNTTQFIQKQTLLSPRMRGWSLGRTRVAPQDRVLPAHAGMVLSPILGSA